MTVDETDGSHSKIVAVVIVVVAAVVSLNEDPKEKPTFIHCQHLIPKGSSASCPLEHTG